MAVQYKRFAAHRNEIVQGYYFAGDGARIDADGYTWITGRVDDVINVSGEINRRHSTLQ